MTGRCFSPGPLVSSDNKAELLDIAEILLKVALNTITQANHGSYPGYFLTNFTITDSSFTFISIFRFCLIFFKFSNVPARHTMSAKTTIEIFIAFFFYYRSKRKIMYVYICKMSHN